MMFSRLASRLREIAAVADVRAKPRNAKGDLAKAPLDKPAQISNVKKPAKSSHNAPVMSKKPPIVDMLPAGIKAANEVINALPPVTHRKTSKAGIDLMHQFEGLARQRPDGLIEAYPDPATGGDPWTIGWGSTGADPFNGGKIRKGTVWTREQCDMHFANHLGTFEAAVRDRLGKAPVSQLQFDAMVSLCYNIGPANFAKSSVLRKHVAGDYPGAARAFLLWNKAAGKVMRGLTRRREAEAALYRSGS